MVAELGVDVDPFVLQLYASLAEESGRSFPRGRALRCPQEGAGRACALGSHDRHAANVLPIAHEIEAAGITSAREVAKALNTRAVRTARGGDCDHSMVRNLLASGDR